MPTYEYKCSRCGGEWELQQRMSEQASTWCPHCQADTAQRLVSASTSFSLRGGGWAKDNYGSTRPR